MYVSTFNYLSVINFANKSLQAVFKRFREWLVTKALTKNDVALPTARNQNFHWSFQLVFQVALYFENYLSFLRCSVITWICLRPMIEVRPTPSITISAFSIWNVKIGICRMATDDSFIRYLGNIAPLQIEIQIRNFIFRNCPHKYPSLNPPRFIDLFWPRPGFLTYKKTRYGIY